MKTVVVVTKGNGRIMFIETDKKRVEDYLKDLGYHQMHDHSKGSNWYDHRNDFVCFLTVRDVVQVS